MNDESNETTSGETTCSVNATAGELKERFKEGSIPLQTDFADLIDFAAVTLDVLGLNPEQQDGKLGLGLESEDHQDSFVKGKKVRVKAGAGITVDNSGVSIDMGKVLPKGIIVMFSGSTAPIGWAFCDGQNETPDLRDRFIAAANTFSDIHGQSRNKLSEDKNNKQFKIDASSAKANITVKVNDTTLTIDQIPSHSHADTGGAQRYCSVGGSGFWELDSTRPSYTRNTGGGRPHNHTASVTDNGHQHQVNVVPAYYILAFIMKL